MLHSTAAVHALKRGCRRLQLPEETAVELVHFLQVKRVHDAFIDPAVRARNMSPGAAVDKLWHFMLLNTDICSMVHGLVGGVVRHVGTDEDNLDDSTKRLQRLYALNIMALEGRQPDVRLWADPGTNMSYIFPAMQPDGTTLYVSPLLTAAETTTLKADLARVFSNSGSSDRDAQTSAADDSTEDEAAGCGGGDAAHHQHAAPAPSVISIISVADGRMFDLQLPDDLAAIGVAAADVKLAMADKLAQPASQLRLVAINYGSHDINPKPVSDTDVVRAKALLRVLLPTAKPPRPPATPYNVVVKALTGMTLDLSGKLAPWMSVYELKLVVQATAGYPPDLQRIIHAGKQIEESQTLKQCNVVHGAVVHCVLKLRGC